MASNKKRTAADERSMVRGLLITDRLLQPHRDVKPKAEITTPWIIGIIKQIILLDYTAVVGHKDPERMRAGPDLQAKTQVGIHFQCFMLCQWLVIFHNDGTHLDNLGS